MRGNNNKKWESLCANRFFNLLFFFAIFLLLFFFISPNFVTRCASRIQSQHFVFNTKFSLWSINKKIDLSKGRNKCKQHFLNRYTYSHHRRRHHHTNNIVVVDVVVVVVTVVVIIINKFSVAFICILFINVCI